MKLKITRQIYPGNSLKHSGEFKHELAAALLRWLLSSSSINDQGLPALSFVLGEY